MKLDELLKNAEVEELEEGWKGTLAGIAMVLGMIGSQHVKAADLGSFNSNFLKAIVAGEAGRTPISVADAKAELEARSNGKEQRIAKEPASAGFTKEFLEKAADPNRFGRYMISVEQAQKLLDEMESKRR